MGKWLKSVLSGGALAVAGLGIAVSTLAEVSGQALAELASGQSEFHFTHVRHNPATENISREIVSFSVDGLNQYALVLLPAGERPVSGWPVLQFNHGYHPDPPRYGYTADGVSSRPGDYYRETAQAFARAGFMVVVPDYRGHSNSEGGSFAARVLADAWYSRDVIVCFLAIASLPDADMSRAFMLGHSMGGPITLRAAQALGTRLSGAAIWSTANARYLPWLLGLEEGNGDARDDNSRAKVQLDAFAQELEALQLQPSQLSPFEQLAGFPVPLSIQHSRGDQSTPVIASLEAAAALYLAGKPYQLKVYDAEEHLFEAEDFTAAVQRDAAFFKELMR